MALPITQIEDHDRIYVIGDIHGCNLELKKLLKHIKEKDNFNSNDQMVFIGDYVSRGYDVPGVIETLLEFQREFPRTVFLRGNHEGMLLDYLGIPGGIYGNTYYENYYNSTFQHYDPSGTKSPKDVIPQAHVDFIRKTSYMAESHKYMFVHAGFHPHKIRDDNTLNDILWIREEFYESQKFFGKIVVHGHTPINTITLRHWKINVDTGCTFQHLKLYKKARLSCLCLTNGQIYSTIQGDDTIFEETLVT